jgi:hypothetical protein
MPEVMITRLLALATAVAAFAGTVGTSRTPLPVDRVPAAIPAAGVDVTGVMVLLPGASGRGLISSAEAVRIAGRNANARIWRYSHAQRAVIRGPLAVAPDGTHGTWATLRNEPAWVVTYSAATPQHVGLGPGAVHDVQHMSVVLDARDGRYVRGILTP